MASTTLTDFEVHIHKPDAGGVHPVSVRVTDQDRRAEGTFASPFQEAEVGRALAWMEQGLFDEAYVKEFGARLFQALFKGDILEVYQGARQVSPVLLRLRLIVDSPAAARLPWELLFDPGRQVFLALESPLVRGASLVEPARALEVDRVLRILIVDAFPEGVPKVDHQVETEGIRRALSKLERRGRVEIQTLSGASLRALQDALREAASPEKSRPFHVLHFIGHGQYQPATGQAVLLFEDESGGIDEVQPETLANILRPYDLKLVFLNACQSLQASALDIAQGFAPVLMASGVPAVIGMQVTVLDEVAKAFARDFYEALADNRPVDAALADARQLLRGTRRRRKADLGIPVGYLRSATGHILELETPQATPLTRETWRPWLREQLKLRRAAATAVALLTFLSTLLGLYLGLRELFPSTATPVPPMSGDFRVAVAEFYELGDQGEAIPSREGREFAQEVYAGVDQAMAELREAGFEVAVRSPDLTGPITGRDAAERNRYVAELANSIGADLVVYGNLGQDGAGTQATLEFYLSERLIRLANEITGAHQWSSISVNDDIRENPTARRLLRDGLAANTKVLTQLLIGIGYYELEQYEQAEKYFITASENENVDPLIAALVLLFRGSTATQRSDLALARSFFEGSLDIRPDYAPAQLGIAGTIYIPQARTGCLPGQVDPQALAQAEREYIRLRSRPAIGSDLHAKATIGLARTYLCMSRAQVADGWELARQAYLDILAQYDAGNTRLRSLAAEASADLGLLEILEVAQPGPSDYLQAEEHYRRAIELSPQADQRAVFYTHLANTQLLLGACEQVGAALDSAEQNYARFRRDNPNIQREDFEAFYQQITAKQEAQCGINSSQDLGPGRLPLASWGGVGNAT